ncbi:hypothetical protein Ccrd_000226 [Cynara cardunculus var. scolymus]|uniref:Uncharacterized protein n=1 Tax=Cynara cardunculus var. scolymus TaxID=59895 RepID=A0A103XVI7_CYNCS|nr:hypothetical protein Ccrd_000226 [Cynara cardunculus var. scolymus]
MKRMELNRKTGKEIPISRIDADAAVIPAFLARSKGESGGKRRDPPRGKGEDHPPKNQDFHHSQLEFLRDELRETCQGRKGNGGG